MSNYQRTIKTNVTAKRAFEAITKEMSDWWSSTSHQFIKLGDRGKVTFEGMETFWTFEATTLDEPNLVVLKCVDSHHVHIGEKKEILTEWLDTELIFEIIDQDNKAQINFTHKGLTPNLHCYNVCEEGWDHFVGESLKKYLIS